MISIVIRTAILYFTVTFGIRLMGKRQIGDMQPNELVVTLLISEIAAIPLQDINQPVLNGIAAIFVLVVLEIIFSVFAMKSFFMRKLLSGKSVVVIKNGKLDQQAMRNLRMTILDLVELLRGQDVFDISEVAFAVVEVNGDLSVLLKTEEQSVKKKDISKAEGTAAMPLPVVCDGKIVTESLRSLEIKAETVEKILSGSRLTPDKVFLMTLDRNGKSNIIRKEG